MSDKHLQECIKHAALELCCGDDPFKNRLASAVRRLEESLTLREDWPAELRRRAQDISDELRCDTAPNAPMYAMDFTTAQRLAERILNLYADSCANSKSN